MSKLYRSLLWSGLVVAGVAACGDDVTVAPPPPPPAATVHSVSVAPTPVTLGVGGTVQLVASVNADAGVATTVAWTSASPAIASVSTSGLVTGLTAGTAAVTACSTVVPGICNAASITVSSNASTVTGITVTPANATLNTSGNNTTVQATASVQGANNPAQTVSWSSLTPGVASVNSTGLITAVATGTAVIKACSTIAGFTGVCGSSSITVNAITPASVQVQSVNWVQPNPISSCTQGTGGSVPVILTNVRCQIEVTVQVNSGDQQLSRVDVLVGPNVLASQSFAVGPTGLMEAPISSDIILSMNTQQVRRVNGILVPVVFNGNQAITSQLYVVGQATPIASNAIPVTMNNADAIVALGSTGAIAATSFVAATGATTFTDGTGTVWFTGSPTFEGAQYISFSTKVPTSVQFTSTTCGNSNNTASTIAGTAQTGITISDVFNCSGVEGQVSITGFNAPTYTAPLNGPDGTPITVPTQLSNLGGPFQVPVAGSQSATETPWNLITPAVPAQTLASIFIDNLGPAVSVNTVAFNDNFDQFWINAAYDFAAAGDLGATDAGSGLASGFPTAHLYTTVCTGTVVVNGADPALAGPTLTSNSTSGKRICAVATDNVGNSTSSGPSNYFGIDFLNPQVRMAGSTVATPTLLPFTTVSVSTVANTTIYPTATFVNERWGMEALDDRAGFDQNLIDPSYPSLQTLVRTLASGATNCSLVDPNLNPGVNGLGIVLSDFFVRNTILIPLDCSLGVGYYTWTGIVTDRAGNMASPVPATRNFAYDPGAPNITGLGYAASLYVGGQPAVFSVSANDDLEIVKAALGLNYTGMPAPGVGILYPEGTLTVLDAAGNPLQPWTTGAGALPVTAVLNAAPITVPYFIARIDESCIFNGNPYVSCDVATNGTGSRPVDPAEYNENLNGGGTLTDAQKGPNAVLANVADITGRESLTGIAAPFLSSQFTAVSQQWNTGTIVTPVPANPFMWTGAIVGGTVAQAINTVNTSIVNPYFNNGVDLINGSSAALLFRLNTVTGVWTFCATFPAPTPLDNGFNRQYTYSLPIPLGTVANPNACDALTGNWKAMGLRNGAGLFSTAF